VDQALDERVEAFRRDVLPRLVERFRPSRVLVLGSRARGDALRESDLDLMVVEECAKKLEELGIVRTAAVEGVDLL
jgi:predicted nucleotidyltransferase